MQRTVEPIRKVLSIGLKIGVSALFFAYLFQEVEWVEVWQSLKRADIRYLSLYLVLGFAVVVINSLKWLVLAGTRGIRPKLPYMMSLYFVGYFFNNFLPTSVGGDFVRGYTLGKAYGKPVDGMASVFVERFTGYTALVVFGLLALACDRKLRSDIRLVVPIGLAILAYFGGLWMILSASWLRLAQRWLPAKVLQKCLAKIAAFQQATCLYRHEPRALVAALGCSTLFYLVSVTMVYVGCLTFNTTVSFVSLLSAVPVLLVLFMIPISFGGVGVQEWAYYFVLAALGVPGPVAVSLGLLFRARTLLFGLLGGALYPFVTRAGLLQEAEPPEVEGASSIGP